MTKVAAKSCCSCYQVTGISRKLVRVTEALRFFPPLKKHVTILKNPIVHFLHLIIVTGYCHAVGGVATCIDECTMHVRMLKAVQ